VPLVRILGVLTGVFLLRPLPEGDRIGTADEPLQRVCEVASVCYGEAPHEPGAPVACRAHTALG